MSVTLDAATAARIVNIGRLNTFKQSQDTQNENKFATKDTFTGATSTANGKSGLVPTPAKGTDKLFLCSNGAWSSVPAGGAATGIGIWSAGKTYKKNDFVSYKDVIYRCLTPNSDSTFDENKWAEQNKDGTAKTWNAGENYVIDDMVKYNGNLYLCLKNHTASTVFNDDYNADNWKMIGDDQTVVGSDGGYSQVTKIGVTAPLTVKIDIGVTNTFCKPPVEVLKKEAGTPSINEVEATFSANENTNYAANRFVTLDNSLHEITEVKYSTSLKETITSGKIYESEEIDPSDYKSISEVKV